MKESMSKKCVDTLRVLSAEVISNANSGHSGIALGAAPILYAAYASIKIDPTVPDWFNRDRFVLSAGHGSALLYTTLHMFGFDIKLEDLKQFRRFKSSTPGHPEVGVTPGVDCSTGPLGQGIAMAVGIAMAEKKLGSMFNKDSSKIIDHYTFCVAGDGCLMEGVSYEACNLAGLHKLNKLIMLYDKNDVTLDGTRQTADGEDVSARFKACGWQVIEVADANAAEPIIDAIAEAKASNDAPTIIICKTTIGFGHKSAGTSKAHGIVLKAEETAQLRQEFGLSATTFSIDKDVSKRFEALIFKKQGEYKKWQAVLDKYKMQWQEEYKELAGFLHSGAKVYEVTAEGIEVNSREAGHNYLNQIAKQSKRVLGVNADVASSTKAYVAGGDDIACGVREFAMAAICNGLALHGFTPFCSTFLSFSDYCRAAIRLTALMNLPVTYIFTHDGLGNAPDGPTHQANEHIASLRLIPDIKVFRPCDDYEIASTYKWVFENGKPSCIILGRGNVPPVNSDYSISADGVGRGGYIIRNSANACVILLSTGSEVPLCIEAAELLTKSGLSVKVVSIPSFELFDAQPFEYREKVLAPGLPKVAVEMGRSDIWYKYLGANGKIIGFDGFGTSAPQDPIMRNLGFTPENIAFTVLDVIKNK